MEKLIRNILYIALLLSILFCNYSYSQINKNLSSDVIWRQEYDGFFNNQYLGGAYSGGMNNSKPTFGDIDNDGDLDLFIGDYAQGIRFYRNDGTITSPSWTYVLDIDFSIDYLYCAPTLVDIDNDNDLDLFVGNRDVYTGHRSYIYFYQNDGTPEKPAWTLMTNTYNDISVGKNSTPIFVDIDNDNDSDLFIGDEDGNIHFYRNDGNANTASWTFVSDNYSNINVGRLSVPAFSDIDNDNDFDLFIGNGDGYIQYYRNDGTPENPSFILISEDYNSIKARWLSAPSFADIDNDGCQDLFLGTTDGNIHYYHNDGTSIYPSLNLVTEYYIFIDIGQRPVFADIDNDDDADLFIGDGGSICYFRNDGTKEEPSWTLITKLYNSIDVWGMGAFTFVDIDNDGDLDLIMGNGHGTIYFYRNDGTPENPFWNKVDNWITLGYIQGNSIPIFVDIDNDTDLDLFVGTNDGTIRFYQNNGTPEVPVWKFVTNKYNNIDIDASIRPVFADIDNDADPDLFIGHKDGNIYFYRNNGSPEAPSWDFVTDNYNSIMVSGSNCAPQFYDIDDDGDLDLFAGDGVGSLYFWRNIGMVEYPDLVIESLDLPEMGIPGQSVTVSNSIKNQGSVAADAFTVNFYLSTDSTITTEDTYLGSRTISTLAAGSISHEDNVFSLPEELNLTPHFVGMIVDFEQQVEEMNENNNIAFNILEIIPLVPDLIFDNIIFTSPEATLHEPINFQYTIKNQGSQNATSFSIKYYLYSIYSESEIYLSVENINGLSGASTLSDNISFDLPPNTETGYYSLKAVIDSEYQITENNENNNTTYSNLFPISEPNFNNTNKTRLYLTSIDKNLEENSSGSYVGSIMLDSDNPSISWDNYQLEGNMSGKSYKMHLWVLSPSINGITQTTTSFKAEIFINEKVVALFNFTSSSSEISSGSEYYLQGVGTSTKEGDALSLKISYTGGHGGQIFWGGYANSFIEIPDHNNISVVNNSGDSSMPNIFSLSQNYPNPFNPQTNIKIALPKKTEIKVYIYDINGRIISKLFEGQLNPGYHNVVWNANDQPSGTYFIKVQSTAFSKVTKCLLLK